jgi:hypothetical protein
MPLGEVGGRAGRPGSIKVNETLILGSAPRPARVRSHSKRAAVVCIAAPSARDGGGEGRDRGVNSAPVVLQQPQREGSRPPFFSRDVTTPSRACRRESRGLSRRDASGADLTFATGQTASS